MGYGKDWKGKGGGKWGSSSSAPPSDALGGSFVPRPGLRGPSGELEPKRPRLSAPPPPPAPGGQHPQSHEGRSKGGWHGPSGGSCDGTQGKSRPPNPMGLPGGGGKGGDMGSLPMPSGGNSFPPPPAASSSCSCSGTSPDSGGPSSCLPLSAAMSKAPPGTMPPSFQPQPSGSTGCSLPMPPPPGASNEPGPMQPLARPPMQQLQTGPGPGPPMPGLPGPAPFSGPGGMSSSPAPMPGLPGPAPSAGPPGAPPGPVPAAALRGPAPPGLSGGGPPLPMPGLPGPAPLTGPSGLSAAPAPPMPAPMAPTGLRPPPPAGLSGGLLTAPTGPLGATFPPLPTMPPAGPTPFGPPPLAATGAPLPGLLPTGPTPEVKVPVSLARATASLVPMKQAPPGTAPAAANAAAPSNKQIAMQFLSADRDKQTEMLRDPKVAMAILQTLGESASKTQPAAGTAPVPGPPPPGQPPPAATALVPGLAAAAPPAPAALPTAGLAAPPAPATAPPAPAAPAPAAADANAPGPSKMAWMGKMTLARSMRKQLQTQATLLYGKVELVELALRSAAGSSGVLNISHRVPYDDVARRTPGAVLQFIPATVNEQIQYGEYIQYFRSKVRAGVAPLDKVEALYLIPPAEETAGLLSSLAAVGVPALPKNCLLGVIADAPGPSVTMHTDKPAAITNTPNATAQAEAGRTSDKAAGNNAGAAAAEGAKAKAEEAAKPAAETSADQAARGPDADKGAQAAASGEDGGDGMEDADGQGQEEFSREALLNLFSNPELLKSLQGAVEEGGGSAAAD